MLLIYGSTVTFTLTCLVTCLVPAAFQIDKTTIPGVIFFNCLLNELIESKLLRKSLYNCWIR